MNVRKDAAPGSGPGGIADRITPVTHSSQHGTFHLSNTVALAHGPAPDKYVTEPGTERNAIKSGTGRHPQGAPAAPDVVYISGRRLTNSSTSAGMVKSSGWMWQVRP